MRPVRRRRGRRSAGPPRRPSARPRRATGEPRSAAPPATPPPRRRTPAAGAARSPPVADRRRPSTAIQLHDAYLVVETPEGMLVIDQHALHERILFEQLKPPRPRPGKLEAQRLLIPEPIDLPAEQAAPRAGAAATPWPSWAWGRGLRRRHGAADAATRPCSAGVPPAEIFRGGRRSPRRARTGRRRRDALFNDLLALMACHAAVRAGDRLTPEEIAALLRAAATWPTTRTTARTAGRRRCCSAGRTWTGSSGGS